MYTYAVDESSIHCMNPTPKDIKQARQDAGLSQSQAAKLINVETQTWQKWEYGTNKMHHAFWELFNTKT